MMAERLRKVEITLHDSCQGYQYKHQQPDRWIRSDDANPPVHRKEPTASLIPARYRHAIDTAALSLCLIPPESNATLYGQP